MQETGPEREYRKTRKASSILAVALIVALISLLGIIAVLHFGNVRKPGDDAGSLQGDRFTVSIDDNDANDTQPPLDILFFASDYQPQVGWDEPADTLKGIMKAAASDGKTPTNAIICGDYTNDKKLHDYQLSPDEPIKEIREIVTSEWRGVPPDDMIFVQGNHDKLTDSISDTGLHEFDNYLIYVLNTENDFPWKQGRDIRFRDRVITASEELKTCLDGLIRNGETRPLIIAGHVPLHFTARTSSRHDTGDNMYSAYVFNVVNEASADLDIIYLTGHNHTKGWDCYLGGSCIFKRPGDRILIPDAGERTVNTDSYTEETLDFTYMNAGYIGHYMNCGPKELNNGTYDQYHAADETLTATVCEIMPDELIITRYSKEGIHPLAGKGEGDPYKGGIDAGLISEGSYNTGTDSPAHIPRKHTRFTSVN